MAVSTDKYYFSLCRIQQEAAHEISFLSTNSLKLDVLMQSMSYEEVTENDYLKLLQMNYDKYDKMDRRREKRYCLVKMQMVADAKKRKYKRDRFKMVDFTPPLREDFMSLYFQRCRTIERLEEIKTKRFLWIDVLLYSLILVLFVYGFHVPMLYSLLIALASAGAMYVYFRFRILDNQIVEEIEKDMDLLDPLLQEMEMSRRNSAQVSLFHKRKPKN